MNKQELICVCHRVKDCPSVTWMESTHQEPVATQPKEEVTEEMKQEWTKEWIEEHKDELTQEPMEWAESLKKEFEKWYWNNQEDNFHANALGCIANWWLSQIKQAEERAEIKYNNQLLELDNQKYEGAKIAERERIVKNITKFAVYNRYNGERFIEIKEEIFISLTK